MIYLTNAEASVQSITYENCIVFKAETVQRRTRRPKPPAVTSPPKYKNNASDILQTGARNRH